MEAEAVGSEGAATTGERCGAWTGGGMEVAPALLVELEGSPAVDGLEAGPPPPELIDAAVDGRDPELDGNASVVLAIIGADTPGKASPNGSRCDERSTFIVSDGTVCNAEDDDDDGRALLMLPG